MNTQISMLRGINVSGQKKIKMDELKRLYEELGFNRVRTYVQSGNVVFEGPEQDTAKLAEMIGDQIEHVFGYSVEVFIRDRQDFRRILDSNPFLDRPGAQPNRLLVTFLYRPPDEAKKGKLILPAGSRDEYAFGEQEIYLYCPDGYGRSKLSNNFFEAKLGMSATTRNWNSVNALYEMAGEP
jgi:uncharacterized protein (DUF1697 family)